MSGFPNRVLAHTTVTAGTTSVELLAANADRAYALIYNDSDATVYIKVGVVAVANQGIGIASGASYVISADNGNLDVRAVNGIAAAASKVMLMTEG